MKRFASQLTILLAFVGAIFLVSGLPAHALPMAPWSPVAAPAMSRLTSSTAIGSNVRVGPHVIGRQVTTSGPIRVLAIPVEFLSDTDPNTTGNGKMPYRTWGPAAQPGYLKDRLTALSQYYSEVSAQRIKLVGHFDQNSPDLATKISLPDTIANYAADQSLLLGDATRAARMIKDIAKLTPGVQYSYYDVVMIIHAGSALEISLDAASTDLKTQFIQVPYAAAVPMQDGSYITGWVQVPETMSSDSFIKSANPGVFDGITPQIDFLQFEKDPGQFTSSNVFIPHFWDVLGSWAWSIGGALGMQIVHDTTYKGGVSLGNYSLMADGWMLPKAGTDEGDPWLIPHVDGEIQYSSKPSHPDAWNKILAGWANVINVTDQRLVGVRLSPQATATGAPIYRMFPNGDENSKEYFLLENRSKIGFDQYIDESGMVVYHVDDNIGTFSAHDLQISATHPRIYPITPGGLTIKTYNASGTKYEYYPVEKIVWPGTTNSTHLGANTTPSTATYSNGPSNIDIANIHYAGLDVIADLSDYNPATALINFRDPVANSTIYVRSPVIRATAVGLDPSSLQATIDGVSIANTSIIYNATDGSLTIYPGELVPGMSHQLIVDATNQITGAAVNAVLNFRVEEKILSVTSAEKFMLISLPVIGVGNADTVFPTIAPANIKLAWWNPITLAYEYYNQFVPSNADLTSAAWAATKVNTATQVMPAGRAFWFKLYSAQANQPASASVRLSGDATSSLTNYNLPVVTGFNMIGNPYNFAIPYSSLQVMVNGKTYSMLDAITLKYVDPVLYSWDIDKQAYIAMIYPNGNLQPWQGYWINMHAGTQFVRAYITYQPQPVSRGLAPESRRPRGSATEWSFGVNATASTGFGGGGVILGVAPGATSGIDASLDLLAPPTSPAGIGLAAKTRGISLYRDLLAPAPGSTYNWTLQVSGIPGSKVDIDWQDLTAVPAGYLLKLTDGTVERYMRSTSSYQVILGAAETVRTIKITAVPGTPGALFFSATSAVKVGVGALLSGTISDTSNITVDIKTMNGALIRRLPAQAVTGGNFTIQWDGLDNRGHRVAHGQYICYLSASTDNGQTAKGAAFLSN